MKHARLAFFFLISISSAFADLSARRHLQMDSRVNRYFAEIGEGLRNPESDPPGCRPSSRECIIFVAGSIPSSGERTQAAKACVGNYGADCVRWASGSLPSFEERASAAKACRDNRTTDCAIFVGGSFPSDSERRASARACGDADVACVKYVAGSFASFEERLSAARSCAARDHDRDRD